MAVNGRSNLHDDAYQSDAGTTPGPLGHSPEVTSTLFSQECASVTFDSQGRLLTVCVGLATVDLRLLDPRTLDVLAEYPLPPRPASSASSPFTAFGGGGYFYLDQRDRVVVPTSDGHIQVIAETGTADAPALTLRRDYDVSADVGSSVILSALPDWDGTHLVRHRLRRRGHGRPPHRQVPVAHGCRTARASATRWRSTRPAASSSSRTGRSTASRPPGPAHLRRPGGVPMTRAPGRSRARARPGRAPPRRSCAATVTASWPSPTTPTPACTCWCSAPAAAGPARGRCARSPSSRAATAPPTTRWSPSGAR